MIFKNANNGTNKKAQRQVFERDLLNKDIYKNANDYKTKISKYLNKFY